MNATPKWKKFEELVAKIQKDLSPQANVEINQRIKGKSGSLRQVDVVIRQNIAQYNLLVAIECKDLKTPVDIKDVEGSIGLFKDIGANKGVIVSANGFSTAAKTVGNNAGLEMYRLVDCGNHDWRTEIALPAVCELSSLNKFNLTFSSSRPERLEIPYGDPTEFEVFDTSNRLLGCVKDLLSDYWNRGKIPDEPGEYKKIDFIGIPTRIKSGQAFYNVDIRANVTVEKSLFYGPVPLKDVSGFHDVINNTIVTKSFTTADLNFGNIENIWRKILSEDELAIKPTLVFCVSYVYPLKNPIYLINDTIS